MPFVILQDEAGKLPPAQNERSHRTHQSPAIYTTVHLAPPISDGDGLLIGRAASAHPAPPISARNSLSMAQAGCFLMHEKLASSLPLFAPGRHERSLGNKRLCKDFLHDARDFKRRRCLMPGFAAANGMNSSSALERLGKPSSREFEEMEMLGMSHLCYQNIAGSFTDEKVNLNTSLRAAMKMEHTATMVFDDRSAEDTGSILQAHSRKLTHTQPQQARMQLHSEKMFEEGIHNFPQSEFGSDGAYKDALIVQEVINTEKSCMQLHVHGTTPGSKGQISDVPFFLPTVLVEEKTLPSEDHDHVSTPSQAQWSEQTSPCQAQLDQRSCLNFSKAKLKVLVDVTNKFQVTATPGGKKHMEEEDVHRLRQRLKQIEFGKNTLGYERYLEVVPKSKRKGKDPRTPNPKQVCSKRGWDGQVRKWRRLLHDYDPPAEDGEELAEDMTVLKSKQKHDEPKLGNGDIHPTTLLSRPQEAATAGATCGATTKDDGLSIYDDWMDC